MATYSNRTDLQNPASKIAATAAKGQTYGEAGKQIAAQKVVPMGASPSDVQKPVVQPGSLGGFNRPTERPNEPVTAGVNAGAGPSYAEAGLPQTSDSLDAVVQELNLLYRQFPNDDLANLISSIQYGGF